MVREHICIALAALIVLLASGCGGDGDEQGGSDQEEPSLSGVALADSFAETLERRQPPGLSEATFSIESVRCRGGGAGRKRCTVEAVGTRGLVVEYLVEIGSDGCWTAQVTRGVAAAASPEGEGIEGCAGTEALDEGAFAPDRCRLDPGFALPCAKRVETEIASEEQAPSEAPEQSGQGALITPSGNIVCLAGGDSLRCDIAERDWEPPPAPASCPVDWGNGISLSASGEATLTCAGDTLLGMPGTTLDYGNSASFGSITCVSKEAGLACQNEQGGGFFLSRESYSLEP